MTFFATFILTFIVIFIALLFFWLKGSPVYRVEKHNVVRLLELVISGQAVDNDWQVFLAYPIRHDDALAQVQARCLELTEREYLGKGGQLFTQQGLEELRLMLEKLKQN